MPKVPEQQLKAAAAAHGFTGREADHYVYGAMNNLGLMHGNKETAKGRAADAKHAAKMGHPHKNLGKYLHLRKRSR